MSGSPGSGKTTLAAALAAEPALIDPDATRGVHLESDMFYRFISAGFVAPHLPESRAQNTAVMDIVVDTVASYADAGYLVVWDGVVGPWFLDRVTMRLAARGYSPSYVVLRAARDESLRRVRRRDGTEDASGAAAMWDQFSDLGEYESHVFASDGATDELITAVCGRLRNDTAGSGSLTISADPWVDDRWPVSVKGIISWGDRTVVLKNNRDEWELPGGRLDFTDATPEDALAREISEELDLVAEVGPLVDSWIYDVAGKRVLVLTYRCEAVEPASFAHSDEHVDVAVLTRTELQSSSIPKQYLRFIP